MTRLTTAAAVASIALFAVACSELRYRCSFIASPDGFPHPRRPETRHHRRSRAMVAATSFSRMMETPSLPPYVRPPVQTDRRSINVVLSLDPTGFHVQLLGESAGK